MEIVKQLFQNLNWIKVLDNGGWLRDIGVPPSPHLTWPRTRRRRAPPGTPRLFCCSTASCLTSPSSYQFCNHSVLDLIQTEPSSHPNKPDWRLAVVGRDTGYGYLSLITCYPATSHTAPVVSLYLLPDKLLGNRRLLYLTHLLVEKTFLISLKRFITKI